MEISLHNWQDDRGSDYDRAKRLLTSNEADLQRISKRVNIPLPTLRAYKQDPEKMKTASWERIHQLGLEAEAEEIANNISASDVLAINNQIHQMLSYLKEDYSGQKLSLEMIDQMEEILTTDPLVTYKIFKALKSILDKENNENN